MATATQFYRPLAGCQMMDQAGFGQLAPVQFTTTAASRSKAKPSKPVPQKTAPKPASASGEMQAKNKQLARERTRLEEENRRLRSELKAVQADKAKQYQFTLPAGLAKLAASIRLP